MAANIKPITAQVRQSLWSPRQSSVGWECFALSLSCPWGWPCGIISIILIKMIGNEPALVNIPHFWSKNPPAIDLDTRLRGGR